MVWRRGPEEGAGSLAGDCRSVDRGRLPARRWEQKVWAKSGDAGRRGAVNRKPELGLVPQDSG